MGGKFVISLDFEKYWGVRDHKSINSYKKNLENVDSVAVYLLDKFINYDIHATWAIVGFLFYQNKQELMNKLPKDKNIYTNILLNPYKYIENENLEKQYHFAMNIIDKIASVAFQEIASHTYSHYYCLEDGQNIKNFEEDLELFRTLCDIKNLNVSTLIFPRNQINEKYIPALKKYGIKAYRGNESHPIYRTTAESEISKAKKVIRLFDRYINISGHNTYLLSKDHDIYNVKSSRFLAPYTRKLKILEPIRLRRIKNSMTYAAKNNEIYHLWWHPHNFGDGVSENMNFLDSILSHYLYLKNEYGMKSRNIKEIVEEL